MITINLLPDVKREYLKSQRTKHLVVVSAVLISTAAVGLMGLAFLYVRILQPRHLSNLQQDIETRISQVHAKKADNEKLVTVQSALQQVSNLKTNQMVTSRIFEQLIASTPGGVAFDSIKFDSATSSITLAGRTTTYELANELADNLKRAQFKYRQNGRTVEIKPYNQIVFNTLSSNDDAGTGTFVSFSVGLIYDPLLFSQSTKAGKLVLSRDSSSLDVDDNTPQQPFFTETDND